MNLKGRIAFQLEREQYTLVVGGHGVDTGHQMTLTLTLKHNTSAHSALCTHIFTNVLLPVCLHACTPGWMYEYDVCLCVIILSN